MTQDADFKARVRARMELTGENYTTARKGVLAAERRVRAAVLMHLRLRFRTGAGLSGA